MDTAQKHAKSQKIRGIISLILGIIAGTLDLITNYTSGLNGLGWFALTLVITPVFGIATLVFLIIELTNNKKKLTKANLFTAFQIIGLVIIALPVVLIFASSL